MKRLKLLQARKSASLTQEKLAKKLGISKQQYSRIENGLQYGNIDMWDTLEDLFQIPQRELREITTKLDDNPAKKTTYQNDTTKKDKTQE